MSKCESCLSKNVCRWYENGTSKNLCCADDFPCSEQKDKNRFIEVPCKVGDTVYKITRNKVKECKVVFIGISADEICSYFNFVENYADGTFYKSYSMVFDVIGKTVFLTKEEAEEKLRELKENG